jgi:hypothetical protein
MRERTQGWIQGRLEQARFISAKQSESQAEVSPSRREVGGSQGSAAGGPSVFEGSLDMGVSVLKSGLCVVNSQRLGYMPSPPTCQVGELLASGNQTRL